MFLTRKYFHFPLIAIFAISGLVALYSPVHAEDTIPPASETILETVPETPPEVPTGESTKEPVAVVETAPTPESNPEIEGVIINGPPENPVSTPVPTEVAATQEPTSEPTILATNSEEDTVQSEPTQEPTPGPVSSQPDEKVKVNAYTNTAENFLLPDFAIPESAPNVVVVGQDGTILPLGSQEADTVLSTADPYFYVGATKFTFTTTNCGPDIGGPCSFPLQAAFDYIATHNISPVGGAVYAEAGTYSSLLINGTNWGNPTSIPASLSLIGVTAVDKQVGSSIDHIISGTLDVRNIKSFTLQAFTVTGSTIVDTPVAGFSNNTGTLNLIDVDVRNTGAGTGLIVMNHSGAINLNGVDASESGQYGAYLDNNASPITIKNSSFNANGSINLFIWSDGAVSLTGVSANSSTTERGALINSKGLTVNQSIFNENAGQGLFVGRYSLGGNVFIQNSQFNSNSGEGLFSIQYGNVDLKNVRATGNSSAGAHIDTCNWDGVDGHYCQNPFTGNITISQSTFTENLSVTSNYGLLAFAKGTINITDVLSEWNGVGGGAWGAELFNDEGSTAWAVNVTNSTFEHNTASGLYVGSRGIITVKDISANRNTNDGLYLNNNDTGVLAGINVLNSAGLNNIFGNNGSNGLEIHSNGPVVVNAVKAENNGESGIYVDNSTGSGTVTIDGVTGGVANNNIGSGIYVLSKGMITVKNMDANNNHQYGYFLNNQSGTNTGVSVLVTLPRWYNGLTGNWLDGLNIQSKGAVTVQKTKANSNGYYGAHIDNSQGTGTVTITDSEFNDNSINDDTPAIMEYGLFVQSKGNITLTNVKANDNGVYDVSGPNDVQGGGGWLDNSTATTPASITITKGTFDNNYGNGLNVLSKGAIAYTTGSANNNLLNAATMDNHTSAANQAVTLDSVNMYGNDFGATGLVVLSKGNITLKGSEINGFLGDGVNLDNSYGTGTVSVSGDSSWWRYFGNNGGDGLNINSKGTVAVSYISINDNDGYGAQISTNGNTSTVTLTNIDFYNNGSYGLNVLANGNITLDNVQIAENHSYGANLDNTSGNGTVTVKSTGGREIRNNTGYGLWILSRGNITLTNIAIHDNGGFGAWLNNSSGTTATVTINSTKYTNWSGNGSYGLQIDSPGAVIVTWVDAYHSGTYGADINNTYATGTAVPTVTITNSWFNNSQTSYGLNVNSKGNISLTNVDANNNAGYGANLNNLPGKGGVTITGPSADDRNTFDNNTAFGLQVLSNGAVTVKYLQANDNDNYGANINNSTAITPLAVTITTADFGNNSETIAGYGLSVQSIGAITLFEVFASSNGDSGLGITGNGMRLDNCVTNGTACTGSGLVSLTSSGAWDNNGYGIDIQSTGEIKLSDISAGYNTLYGGKFNNALTRENTNPSLPDIKSTAGVTISLPAGYSTEWGTFTDNGQYGFMITSNGAVSVSNVRVLRNAGTQDYAALINNSTADTPMAVTITASTFSDNPLINGIVVTSKGAITFTNNNVRNNSGTFVSGNAAAILDNHLSTLAQNVTVTGSSFQSNSSGSGLIVLTKGNVLATNVNASGNREDGLNINASYGNGTVTMNGTRNTFNKNGNHGVAIAANGNVIFTNIEAEYNTGRGLSVDTYNFGHTGTGIVTITNANLNRNGTYGFWSHSNGATNLNNMTATGNGSTSNNDGAYMITNNQDITITNSTFTGNVGRGITSNTGAGKTLKLVGTSFYGNDTNKSGDANLSYTGLISIS
jgi:putative surface-exposed virulence protein